MVVAFNEMETARFGIRCARVPDPNAPLAKVNAAARAEDIAFLSTRVSTDDIACVQALEEDGYRLMDTLVYYHAPLPVPEKHTTLPEGTALRAALSCDTAAVSAVAGEAFAGFYGHFHADPRLSQADCDAVYVDWAGHCVRSQTEELPVLVSETGGRITGFLAARRISETCADIALNAVSPRMQGQGIYGALLEEAMAHMARSGFQEVTISTQVNNITVQKAWGKRGLRMQESFYTLHKWLD